MVIKILASSKVLAEALGKIDFDGGEFVIQTRGEGAYFVINTNRQTIAVWVDFLHFHPRIPGQDSRGWNHIKDLLTNVAEQPVIVEITEKIVQVTFQY